MGAGQRCTQHARPQPWQGLCDPLGAARQAWRPTGRQGRCAGVLPCSRACPRTWLQQLARLMWPCMTCPLPVWDPGTACKTALPWQLCQCWAPFMLCTLWHHRQRWGGPAADCRRRDCNSSGLWSPAGWATQRRSAPAWPRRRRARLTQRPCSLAWTASGPSPRPGPGPSRSSR